jgi:Holliday junction resolvase
MAMTPEAKVKKAVKQILTEQGVYFFMPAANGYGHAGIPDIICCIDGQFVGIECKAGKGKTTALQDREIEKINTSGGIAFVVSETNIGYVNEVINSIRSNAK